MITPEDLRAEAARRTSHGYVYFATVREMMRKLADHMEAMAWTENHDDEQPQ